jgi:AcrR family transcriptional regulator
MLDIQTPTSRRASSDQPPQHTVIPSSSARDTMAPPRAPDRRLISAARALFAREGFDAASLRDISRIAGLNVGAVDYHFGSKRALYEAVVASALRPLVRCARSAADEEGAPEERLLSVAAALAGHVREHPDVPALLLQEVAVGRPPPPPAVFALGRLRELLTGLARKTVAAGAGSAPDATARRILYHVLGGNLVEQTLAPDAFPPDVGQEAEASELDDPVWAALEGAVGETGER